MLTRALVGALSLIAVSTLPGQSPFGGGGRDTSSGPPEPPVTLRGPVLGDSDVVAAVHLGQAKKNNRTYGYVGAADCTKFVEFMASSDALRTYTVIAQGPFGRIVDASAEATRKYLTFGSGDVSAEMRAPTLTVGVEQNVEKMTTIVAPVEHVVIRGVNEQGDPGPAVQPTHVEPLPASYQNLMGAKVETKGVLATFDLQALPPGDLQIVVILSNRECHATIHQHDRVKTQ